MSVGVEPHRYRARMYQGGETASQAACDGFDSHCVHYLFEMKRQIYKWSCGSSAVRNVMRVFGDRVGEDVIIGRVGTTKDGTDDFQIVEGLRSFGYDVTEHSFDDKKEAWVWLHTELVSGHAVVLAVDCWEHWVVAHGSMGERVSVFDPANWKYNVAENGTYSWDYVDTMRRWWYSRVKCEGARLYAISAKKRI